MENNHRTQEAAANPVTRSEEPHDAVDDQMMQIMGEINKTAQNLQSSVNKAGWFAGHAAHMTMKMVFFILIQSRGTELTVILAFHSDREARERDRRSHGLQTTPDGKLSALSESA